MWKRGAFRSLDEPLARSDISVPTHATRYMQRVKHRELCVISTRARGCGLPRSPPHTIFLMSVAILCLNGMGRRPNRSWKPTLGMSKNEVTVVSNDWKRGKYPAKRMGIRKWRVWWSRDGVAEASCWELGFGLNCVGGMVNLAALAGGVIIGVVWP